jgi:probable HAF family extracellular repeat protein
MWGEQMRSRAARLCFAGGLALVTLPPVARGQQLYTTTDLSEIYNKFHTCPTGYIAPAGVGGASLNRAGDVVGYLGCASAGGYNAPPDYTQAFFYHHRSGRFEPIGGRMTGTDGIYPTAINAAGRVAGDESLNQSGFFPFTFYRKQMTRIGAGGHANGLNDRGTIVGEINWVAFEWNNGVLISLAVKFGADTGRNVETQASAINNKGDITGECSVDGVACGCTGPAAGFTSVACLLRTDGRVVAIEPPDGVPCGSEGPGPSAINRYHEVAGCVPTNPDGYGGYNGSYAFLWTRGQLWNLGAPPGTTDSCALGMNDAGVIVGGAWNWNGTDQQNFAAFVWNGQMTDLNTLIAPTDPLYGKVQLTSAVAINDTGQILAAATYASGGVTTLILNPAPASQIAAAK